MMIIIIITAFYNIKNHIFINSLLLYPIIFLSYIANDKKAAGKCRRLFVDSIYKMTERISNSTKPTAQAIVEVMDHTCTCSLTSLIPNVLLTTQK